MLGFGIVGFSGWGFGFRLLFQAMLDYSTQTPLPPGRSTRSSSIEREREGERDRQRQRGRATEREREREGETCAVVN